MIRPMPRPVTPRTTLPEANLRRAMNADRALWDEERRAMEAERTRLSHELAAARKELRAAENRADRLQAQLPDADPNHLPGLKRARKAADVAVARAQAEASQLREALTASRYRRSLAMQVCAVLVATEDNPRLTDAEYERRMEVLLRRARTLVALDKLERERERGLLAPEVTPAE